MRPYPLPRAHYEPMKAEINRLVKEGVLVKAADTPWGAATFGILKPNKTMRVLTDFREVNKLAVRKPYPLPPIKELFLSIEDSLMERQSI
jgi:hypothetical protein